MIVFVLLPLRCCQPAESFMIEGASLRVRQSIVMIVLTRVGEDWPEMDCFGSDRQRGLERERMGEKEGD